MQAEIELHLVVGLMAKRRISDSEILPKIPLELGGNAFLSSPKRYSWDTDSVGDLGHVGRSFWTMHVNGWHHRARNYLERLEFPKLSATTLLLMDETGTDWALGPNADGSIPTTRSSAAARPPHSPDAPGYPRADALTWAALTVLECSYRYIMSEKWRKLMQHLFVPRRLRNVVVTFPSGWTGQELAAYRAKWQKALDIFSVTRFKDLKLRENGGQRPSLVMEIDEAVASQLPIIYGEINRLGNIGENWVELVGRGKGIEARARIMNLDIGGGTSDIAVVEYWDEVPGPGVVLNTELLYKDCSTVAGDALVRSVIERVLLPAICVNKTDDQRTRFRNFLESAKQERTARWNRSTRQVLIPIVRHWLSSLATGRLPEPPQNMVPGPALELIAEFNAICQDAFGEPDFMPPGQIIHYDVPRLISCITETFSDYTTSLAKVSESFDCDLLIVSGKPSELPQLQELILSSFPLPNGRIIFSHNYPVGTWYPVSPDGFIRDAKTVTVAGAALYQAVKKGLIQSWKIHPSRKSSFSGRNYWGQMPGKGGRDFARIILNPDKDTGSVKIMVGERIGRRLLPTRARPDPVYRLRWSKAGRRKTSEAHPITVQFERTPAKLGGGADSNLIGETLSITSVTGEIDGKAIEIGDVELQLCTLDSDDFWMDHGIFTLDDL